MYSCSSIFLLIYKIDNCQVIQIIERDYTALQIGTGPVKIKNVSRALLGHFEKFGIEPKRKICEFRVTKDAFIEQGIYL